MSTFKVSGSLVCGTLVRHLSSGVWHLSSLVPHMHEGGADIRFIQKLLGHASLETTAIYTEMNVESLRQVFASCHPTEKRWKEKQC
jgi:site-specific recombinase XerC